MLRRSVVAVATMGVLASVLVGCGEDYTDAQQTCVDALEERFGEDGLVKVDDLAENASDALTKVEGELVYRHDQGAGDRVDTWFTCQVDEAGAVTNLVVKD